MRPTGNRKMLVLFRDCASLFFFLNPWDTEKLIVKLLIWIIIMNSQWLLEMFLMIIQQKRKNVFPTATSSYMQVDLQHCSLCVCLLPSCLSTPAWPRDILVCLQPFVTSQPQASGCDLSTSSHYHIPLHALRASCRMFNGCCSPLTTTRLMCTHTFIVPLIFAWLQV